MVFFFSCFFSSRRRHTRCALVTGVQMCALPIYRLLQNLAKDPERLKHLPGSLQGLSQVAGIAIPELGGEAGGAGGLGGLLPGAPGAGQDGQKGQDAPGADLLRGLLGGKEPKNPAAPTGKTAPQEREPAPGPRSLQEPEPEQREPADPQRMLRGLFGR